MNLLDCAGFQLGWHPDWPEARLSIWHELPVLTDLNSAGVGTETIASCPEYGELHLSIFIPPMPVQHDLAAKAPHVNYCGGCFQCFEAMNAITAANTLHHHIEAEPCTHYEVPAAQATLLPLALASST
jgi:hypothetical protein